MARLVKRSQDRPFKVLLGGEEKFLCMCGLSKSQPFCDGSHKLARGEDPGKLYWYDNAGERHACAESFNDIRGFTDPETERQVLLVRRELVAEDTMAFYFSTPEGFSFKPGQSILVKVAVPSESGSVEDGRRFTIASAPQDRELMIVTRLRNTPFKQALKDLPVGAKISINGPSGALVLNENADRPLVFLAGGIGITPFLSMSRDAVRRRLPHPIWLFYGNRRPEDAAFLDELHELERQRSTFHVIAVMSQAEKSARGWIGETGFIRRELLERHLADPRVAHYYFAGPPEMTAATREMLKELGVPKRAMRSEEFYGY